MSLKAHIEFCRKDPKKGFRTVYDFLAPRLMTTAKRYVSEEDAMDILQDSFLKIYDCIMKKDLNQLSSGHYFHRIVINNCLKRIKKKRLIQFTESQVSSENVTEPIVYDRIRVSELFKALHELSDAQRICFSMYEIDGFSHREIAAELGISPHTSRSYLSRAKKLLKEKFDNKNVEK